MDKSLPAEQILKTNDRMQGAAEAAGAVVMRREPAEVSRPQVPAKPAAIEMDERGLYRIVTQHDEFRVAKMLLDTKAVPQAFKTPEQVMMAIQALKSLGLNWRTALRQCGFTPQGAFMVYGDLELAVVRQSGCLEDIHEYLVVKNDDGTFSERCMANNNIDRDVYAAVCVLKRKSFRAHESIFTVDDAKQAGLWGKTPTWRNHSSRMMQMRARGIAIRNVASDITQGLAGVEYDHEGIDYGKSNG